MAPAYERPIADIIADLSKPVKQRHISTRPQGGNQIEYISWHHAEQYLDYYASGWSKSIDQIQLIGDKVVMVIRLMIPAADGVVSREATGYEDLKAGGYGDPFSNAESMALRRAAANFGLGRYLYDK